MSPHRFPYAARHAFVRSRMAESGLDALVVSNRSNIRYLTGFSGSSGALVLEPDAARLIVDFRYITAAGELLAGHADLGIETVLSERSEDETLLAALGRSRRQRIGVEGASMSIARFNRLSSALAGAAPTPLTADLPCPVLVPTDRLIERARAIKDAVEIAALRAAAGLLARVAVEHVPALLQPGRTEAEVAGAIDLALRGAGFERPAFETIVASGPNSGLPHARPGPRRLAAGDPVVLDFGGVYDGYCVDLTRTVQLAPHSSEFRRFFAAVAEAHDAAIAAVRPGTLTTDIDDAARAVIERQGLGEAFGHGTGHGLGLDVHEEPRISKADPARPPVPVEPGMVFTIEPGVYVPGVGGVRLEDDVLVTGDGCEVLTRVPLRLA